MLFAWLERCPDLDSSLRPLSFLLCSCLFLSPSSSTLNVWWNLLHSSLFAFAFALSLARLSWSTDPGLICASNARAMESVFFLAESDTLLCFDCCDTSVFRCGGKSACCVWRDRRGLAIRMRPDRRRRHQHLILPSFISLSLPPHDITTQSSCLNLSKEQNRKP